MQKNKKTIQSSLTTFIKQKKSDGRKESQEIDSNLSKSSENQHDQQNKKSSSMKNVEFYRNQRKSQPSGDFIVNIHRNWSQNFTLLQRHHGFIQWLFPNSFTSRFNPESQALSKEEEKIFRTDMTIAERYVFSYQMMLQFYGMKLKSKKTGQITQTRTFNYKQRYRATLLTSFHNHLRITRILCSLTMVGFGRYAKKLSEFLNHEIHSQNGELRALAKYNIDKDWKQYKDYIETYEDLNVYLQRFEKKDQYLKTVNNKFLTSDEKQKSTQKLQFKMGEKEEQIKKQNKSSKL